MGKPTVGLAYVFYFWQQKVKRYFSGIEIWMLIINAICILHYLVNPSLNLVQRIEIDLCFLSTCIIRQ